MKKIILFTVVFLGVLILGSSTLEAQVLDGIYTKEHIPKKRPIDYKTLREADVMWSKKVWRIIDVREKINQHFYYPTAPIGSRKSLIDVLLYGINAEGLSAYSDDDDQFTTPIGIAQIEESFGAVEKAISYQNEEGNEVTETIKEDINGSEIKQYIIKEEWFFDKKHSAMDVRVIGICPIRFYTPEESVGDVEERKTKVFWVHFSEIRRVLATHEVFNDHNDAERHSYDDLFIKRRFNSFIIQESNAQDNRRIDEYAVGVKSLLESEKIKNRIADYEQDLWQY